MGPLLPGLGAKVRAVVGAIVKLVMGVVEIPYANLPTKDGKPGAGGTQTTYDVARWLEAKYGVMETFARMQEPAIAAVLENALAGHLENLLMGAPASDPFVSVTEELGQMFRTFLDEDEVRAAGVPGTPTAASLKGVNHRMKSKKGPVRPSFIDTGLYRSSAKFWIEES